MSDRSTTEPVWMDVVQVKLLHEEAVRLFGGLVGIRDERLLESAIARPRNLWAHDESATLFNVAAAYGFGLARNHAFFDGNKRTALLAIRIFMFRNGYRFSPDEVETVTMMEGLADGSVNETHLSVWIESASEAK